LLGHPTLLLISFFARQSIAQLECRSTLGQRWRTATPKNRRTRGPRSGCITITQAGLGLRRTTIGPNANAAAIFADNLRNTLLLPAARLGAALRTDATVSCCCMASCVTAITVDLFYAQSVCSICLP
jgi:hypothetical protein